MFSVGSVRVKLLVEVMLTLVGCLITKAMKELTWFFMVGRDYSSD